MGSHKGHHHYISCALIAEVEDDAVRLSANGDVAYAMIEEDEDEDEDEGARSELGEEDMAEGGFGADRDDDEDDSGRGSGSSRY
jgi:hypothetical protein